MPYFKKMNSFVGTNAVWMLRVGSWRTNFCHQYYHNIGLHDQKNSMQDLTLSPQLIWDHFEALCQIPRASMKEEKVLGYIKKMADELGLSYKQDKEGNVAVFKPASLGKEQCKTVVMQSHVDMVHQKNRDKVFNFDTDAIQTQVDGDWMVADGTTLGADNGIGVAAMLAVLEDKELQHGALVTLFTVNEEVGLTGAKNLSPSLFEGDMLFNLDSEEEGEIYMGCAGGIDTTMTSNYIPAEVSSDVVGFEIRLIGLQGGHSGGEIHLGRGNAIKLINRFLWQASMQYDMQLISWEGGSLRNAIPRESFVEVVIPSSQKAEFLILLQEFANLLQREYAGIEPSLSLTAYEVLLSNVKAIGDTDQQRLLNAVYGCPNGVLRMSPDVEELVETSTNLSCIKVKDGKIRIESLQRSAINSGRDDVCYMIRSVFEQAGFDVTHSADYPGWKPNPNSEALQLAQQTYLDLFGHHPDVKAIHAGLECGIIGNIYPNLDMISFGPTIRNPHSPDEKVHIPSVVKFWTFLTELLKNVS